MRTLAIAALFAMLIPFAGTAQADVTVTVDPAKITLGYMNVFNLPSAGGAFQFGTGWGFGDLVAYYSGTNLTLAPNVIGDPNEYWYQCVGGTPPPNCGGPGAPGNKIMEANAYAEETGTLGGQTVTFNGEVLANSLTSAHTVIAFIKDFAPDFSSFIQSTVVLGAPGPFSISLATINAPGRHVQWGFQMTGVNVWVTDVAPFGTITIGPERPIPTEATTWGRIKAQY